MKAIFTALMLIAITTMFMGQAQAAEHKIDYKIGDYNGTPVLLEKQESGAWWYVKDTDALPVLPVKESTPSTPAPVVIPMPVVEVSYTVEETVEVVKEVEKELTAILEKPWTPSNITRIYDEMTVFIVDNTTEEVVEAPVFSSPSTTKLEDTMTAPTASTLPLWLMMIALYVNHIIFTLILVLLSALAILLTLMVGTIVLGMLLSLINTILCGLLSIFKRKDKIKHFDIGVEDITFYADEEAAIREELNKMRKDYKKEGIILEGDYIVIIREKYKAEKETLLLTKSSPLTSLTKPSLTKPHYKYDWVKAQWTASSKK